MSSLVSTAAAQASSEDSPERVKAREAFLEGTKLAQETMWAEALTAFERAQFTVPHAITLFNIGLCERALGRYTSARRTLRAARAEHDTGRTKMPERLREDVTAHLAEIETLLVRTTVTIRPRNAAIAIDGRPLSLMTESPGSPRADSAGEVSLPSGDAKPGDALPVAVAGLRPPGKGESIPHDRFELEMDPGRHVIALSRPGFGDVLVTRDFSSGKALPLDLSLDELPATIQISADQRGAIVTVEGKDLGPTPITLRRPAGSYKILVEKDGFVSAEGQLNVKAGEETSFRARLPVDEPSIAETWWFWTIAGAAVTGVAVGTYFLAREEPAAVRPTVGGGSLDWRVPLP